MTDLGKYLESAELIEEELNIHDFDVIKLTKKSKYTKEIAEKALKNVVIPFPNFSPFDFDNNGGWEFDSEKYGDSYPLYIHSLRFVSELLTMFEETEEMVYLDKAKYYIHSWINYAVNNKGGAMVWYDHPTANRIQVIINYLYLAKGKHNVDTEQYGKLLRFHSLYLSNNKNYRRNNHGLMMDRSLMILGNILKDENIFNLGYYRSIDTFWYSYSYTGLHLENSPEYHNMVTRMYLELQAYLKKNGKSYGNTIVSYLSKAAILKNTFAKPNKVIPSIGDSGQGQVKVNKEYNNFIDYAAGLSIIQDKEIEMFLSFICGYSTTVHKHIDDLSFNLYLHGKDFFVDPGKFSYSKHPYRGYVKSFKGHSGIFINDKNYKLSEENRFTRNVTFMHHFENDEYMLIKGKNHSYEEAELYRTIIYLKNDKQFVILDEIRPEQEVAVLHNFNLHHEVKAERINDYSYKLINDSVSLVLKNHTENMCFEEIEGNKDKEPYIALNSVIFNEVVETIQLKNNESLLASQNMFTVYSISEDSEEMRINLNDEASILHILTNDKNYYINV